MADIFRQPSLFVWNIFGIFAKNHFTDLYRAGDGMIIGVCMGYLGISQIGDFFINFLKKKGFSNDK